MTIEEAIKNIKKTAKEKFDATIEVHIKLDLDVTKGDQQIRYTTSLPAGTGKNVKVAVFASGKVGDADLELTETDLNKIESGEIKPGRDFDILVAEPKYMPKLSKVAKILGPAGVMPNPKNGTVTENVADAVKQIKKGKIEIRTEQNHPLVHTIIGKKSFSDEDLVANFKEVIHSLRVNKPQKAGPDFIKRVTVCSSMGKSFEVEF